ncbi:MAG: glutamate/tyrosine decarboxylase-like PLP-dependent enzyme [Parasphingorhabdus sp.]|jgi:glutamate/tyrosine decarboxylase-like PLP-dependent enzyme
MTNKLQQNMFHELEHKKIFNQAKEYAFQYSDTASSRNVVPGIDALNNLHNFDEALPNEIGDASQVIQQLNNFGGPATVVQTAGRYFGFVNGGVLPVALAARWLADFWDQNAALNVMSPVAAKLESVCEQWLRSLFGLPDNCVAGFVGGSSMAILCGLAAARFRLYERNGWDINKQGFVGAPKLRIVTGKQSHATVVKAIALLGFGTDNIEWVAVDDQGRILVDQVPELDSNTILILQASNVSSGAFDDFDSLVKKANACNAWVHVDGAFGLWAQCCDTLKHLTKGISEANSFSVDAHKTLNAPYDSGIVLCSDREALTSALQASGSYIVYGEKRDGMMYTPDMSRRARSIELWSCLKYLGRQGVDDLVLQLHQHAQNIAVRLAAEKFNILNDVVFNQVLVTCDSDSATLSTLDSLQNFGVCWMGGAKWQNRDVIRISICSWATTTEDIDKTVEAFLRARDAAQA